MSQFIPFGSGGGPTANLNLNNSEERLGFATDGTGTTITAGGSNNTKGSYTALGTSTNDWAGFWLSIGAGSASTGRYCVDIRVGGSTIIVPNLYVEPGQNVAPTTLWLPLAVTAGAIDARCQAETSGRTIRLGLRGIVRNAQSAPMYSTMTAINVDTTNTRASGTDIACQGSAGTTYGDLSSSLAATYNAFLFSPGGNGTTPGTSQQILFSFATGAAASETEVSSHSSWITNAAAAFSGRDMGYIERTIASGTRLSVKPIVATPGTDNVRCAAYGFA